MPYPEIAIMSNIRYSLTLVDGIDDNHPFKEQIRSDLNKLLHKLKSDGIQEKISES